MKKTLIPFLFIITFVIIAFSSCSNDPVSTYPPVSTNPDETTSPTPSIIMLDSLTSYPINGYYYSVSSQSFRKENMANQEFSFYDLNGYLEYSHSRYEPGHDYVLDFYDARMESDKHFYALVALHAETNEIVYVWTSASAIATPQKNVTTEQEFIEYAKTFADDFANLSDYNVKVYYQYDPGTIHTGNHYAFIKQLHGYDTDERIIISIAPDGKVHVIENRAIDQFKDFETITFDDSKMEKALYDAITTATQHALPYVDAKGTTKITRTDHYLVNDGGTLLLYAEIEGWYTPTEEEDLNDEKIDGIKMIRGGAIVQIAKLG